MREMTKEEIQYAKEWREDYLKKTYKIQWVFAWPTGSMWYWIPTFSTWKTDWDEKFETNGKGLWHESYGYIFKFLKWEFGLIYNTYHTYGE
jgi:hypothetical protein